MFAHATSQEIIVKIPEGMKIDLSAIFGWKELKDGMDKNT